MDSSSTSSHYNVDELQPAHDCYGGTTAAYASTAMGESSSTLYVPIASPPTPAPSPRLSMSARPILPPDALFQGLSLSPFDPLHISRREFANLATLGSSSRQQYLISLLSQCTPAELLFISTTIAPLLKRDFLKELPTELSLYILCFVDEPRTLTRASQVSRHWQTLLSDEWVWKRMCDFYQFDPDRHDAPQTDEHEEDASVEGDWFTETLLDPILQQPTTNNMKSARDTLRPPSDRSFSYQQYFKYAYRTSKAHFHVY
jgi:F-box and WD-40 domain protein CDC4